MEINGDTKLIPIIDQYPQVYDALHKLSKDVEQLKSPIARKVMGEKATLIMVSEMLYIPLETLITTIQNAIEASDPLTDQSRKEDMKQLILDIHKGVDIEILKSRFRETIGDISPAEIGAIEQELIDEGILDTKKITKLSDFHVELVKDALDPISQTDIIPGHPVHTYLQENLIATNLIRQIRTATGQDKLKLFHEIAKIELHYTRKENQLFPLLEKYGISGPAQVMWAVHDEIRGMLKTDRIDEIEPALKKIEDMIIKEEHILFPLALETLVESDWIDVYNGEEEIGYVWEIVPGDQWKPDSASSIIKTTSPPDKIKGHNLSIGNLTIKQIDVMLKTLPVDITFVDENDEVAYYSGSADRIFPRSRAIIGRKVQKCHPAESLEFIEDILNKFKSGEKNIAEFWIQMGNKLIMIRYFAMRDEEGKYVGTLEASQELNRLREIEGEQRLVQWGK